MNQKLFWGLILLTMTACKGKIDKIKPVREDITESVYASGLVKAFNQYQVYSTVSGTIKQVLVEEGDTVRVGQPLVLVTNETSRLNAENARLNAAYNNLDANKAKLEELAMSIDVARSKYINDSLLWIRQQNLWKQQVGSQVEYEQRLLALQNSRATYESARLRYNDLRRQLSFADRQARQNLSISESILGDYTVKSDVNGLVYSISREKGELVSPQTPLAVLGDAARFKLELQVDEYDIVRIHEGQQVFITLDSYKGKAFEAVVKRVNPLMNERTKTFTVEAWFVHAPDILYPNLSIEASVVINKKHNALTLPRNCVAEDGTVMLANGNRVKVKTGLKDYEKIEILNGITEQDEIIVSVK